MKPINLAAVMITCPDRAGICEETLLDLRRHEPDLRVWVQMDETSFERRQERQEHNSLRALVMGLQRFPDADAILFFEDDLVFNRHLDHNLQHWMPLRNHVRNIPGTPAPSVKRMFFGSLYDPTIREITANPKEHYFIADPNAVYGSQAFVMSRAMAEHFVEHWWEVPGMQDIKMSRMAARAGVSIYYHMPSLVQHVGVRSTWTDDNRFHDTKSYDPDFKA